MIEIEELNVTMDQLFSRLVSIYEKMSEIGDEANVKKIIELINKVHKHEYTIGFCGHFSAGKSSMINELMGEKILPSSPIPTSANIVKIKSGNDYVRIYNKANEIIEYPLPYDFELIQSYCKNGEEIELLEISHQTEELPKDVTVMDTPGIDSTDEAHQKSTMSALHLADLILYVMDYNHVQSEQNFQFTKMLKDEGKQLFLVINQIDKHRDQELSFADFKKGVAQAFRNWHVEPDAIFYTSIRNKNVANNELENLKKIILEKMAHRDEQLIESIQVSAHKIIKDHLLFLQAESQSEVQAHENMLSPLNNSERNEVRTIVSELEKEINIMMQKSSVFERDFQTELQAVLNSAYMMPFEIRELAKLFVESCQPNFKVGLLFSKAKTEKEKQDRLMAFYQKLRDNVTNQLERHIQQFVIAFIKKWDISNSEIIKNAQMLSVTFEPTLLENVIKKGASLTGEYILNYTQDLANEIKKLYKHEALLIAREIVKEIQLKVDVQLNSISKKLTEYKAFEAALTKLANIHQQHEQIIHDLQQIIDGIIEPEYNHAVKLLVMDLLKENIMKKDLTTIMNDAVEEKIEEKDSTNHYFQPDAQNIKHFGNRVANTVTNLRNASQMVQNINGLSLIAREIEEKANRLEDQNFTVALFGAFSAGKSSFANALMGDAILPVSPNPTTATINKIVPPNENYKHGTVKVKLKTNEQLLADIQHSLKVFGISISSLSEAMTVIQEKLAVTSGGSREKTHYNFLKAVQVGFSDLSELLGSVIDVGLNGFHDFVAKEEKACFVEWIELYYDCPLTQKGITLVDTPGADSVNARHTGVAFEYIKNADAILFVTYYNHAFSKADREFLIQLGRVKDTFAMDKMFFIVNAADLASTHDELAEVVQYVGNQLVHYGIRTPRLYPISSQQALAEKLGDVTPNSSILANSGIVNFEADFNQFIIEELTEMTINSAIEDLNRLIHILKKYIFSAKESNETKVEKLNILTKELELLQKITNHLDIGNEQEAIKREIEELIYYIKQRIFLRYPDLFKESFNPSVLREDTPNIKDALKGCLQELVEFIGRDLAQEIRATSLRIERFLKFKLQDVFEAIVSRAKMVQLELELTTLQKVQFHSFDVNEGLQDLNCEDKQYKKALSIYKNAKSFFEKNEKRFMSEELENQLQQPIASYLNDNQLTLTQFYQDEFKLIISALTTHIDEQINLFYDGMMAALQNKTDIDEMEQIIEQLSKMVDEK